LEGSQVAPEALEDLLDKNPSTGFEEYPASCVVGLEIKDLVKTFGKKRPAIAGLSLRMLEGEIFALLGSVLNLHLFADFAVKFGYVAIYIFAGHNGAGKTTTIACCIGMTEPSSGTIIVNGYDL